MLHFRITPHLTFNFSHKSGKSLHHGYLPQRCCVNTTTQYMLHFATLWGKIALFCAENCKKWFGFWKKGASRRNQSKLILNLKVFEGRKSWLLHSQSLRKIWPNKISYFATKSRFLAPAVWLRNTLTIYHRKRVVMILGMFPRFTLPVLCGFNNAASDFF